MARNHQDWENIGRNIQDIVDHAVSSQDYQKLEQTIRQAVGRAVDLGGEAVRKAVDSVPKERAKPREVIGEVVEEKNLPVLYGPTGGKTALGIMKIVGGSIVSAASLLLLATSIIVDVLLTGSGSMGIPALLLGVFAGGFGLVGNGISNLNRLSRFKSYRKLLGNKTSCALENLARTVGRSEKFVRKEVQKMINERLFLEGHLDREQETLIVSHETYKLFEQSRLQLEQRKQLEEAEKQRKAERNLSPQVQEVLDRGNDFIRQLRSCNDAIPGEEISRKISRIEVIVQRIFERAEAHPEIIPDLKKMMDYYLPMTVKLLNAYADMDRQPVQGETIQNSKREIEATLDTLNLAFEKLLDSVFADTALDVSSDISVLNTLLAQEGLTEDELSKMRNKS